MIMKGYSDYEIQLGDSTYTIEESEFPYCVMIRRIHKDGYQSYLGTDELHQMFIEFKRLDKLCQKYKEQLNEYEYAAKIMKNMIDGVD